MKRLAVLLAAAALMLAGCSSAPAAAPTPAPAANAAATSTGPKYEESWRIADMFAPQVHEVGRVLDACAPLAGNPCTPQLLAAVDLAKEVQRTAVGLGVKLDTEQFAELDDAASKYAKYGCTRDSRQDICDPVGKTISLAWTTLSLHLSTQCTKIVGPDRSATKCAFVNR